MLRRIVRNLWRRGIGSCVSQLKREFVSMAGVRLDSRKSIELSTGNLRVYFLKFFKRHRDSHYQNSNRVHFLFMRATVRQDAEPCWQPATSLTHNRM
jgi:hypothetical protein